jgi:hypothetical protein
MKQLLVKCDSHYWDAEMDFKQSGEDFTLSYTSRTASIKYINPNGRNVKLLFSDRFFPFEFFTLIKELKKEFDNYMNSGGIIPDVRKQEIFYYQKTDSYILDDDEVIDFDNCCQFDINKAYYTIARNLEYISEAFYEKCLGLEKSLRLALIGSSATKKHIINFKNGEKEAEEIINNPEHTKMYLNIVRICDNILSDFRTLENNDFLFYWVDGIFLKNSIPINTLLFLKVKYNVDFKQINVFKVRLIKRSTWNEIRIFETESEYLENNPKIFFFPADDFQFNLVNSQTNNF